MTGTLIELDGLLENLPARFECHYGVVTDRSVDQAGRVRRIGWPEWVWEINNIEHARRAFAAKRRTRVVWR